MSEDSGSPIVRIVPAGDAALRLELPQRIDPQLNARAIAIAERLRHRCGSALRDVVVGYATLTVYFDPLIVDSTWLEAEMREAAGNPGDPDVSRRSVIEVPVCYGGEFGPDLPDVAHFANCSEDDVVSLHAAIAYRVYMVGFVPGFAYMASVDARIAAPRRATPRPAIPAGSVAIAGEQTGVYPAVTPGGWNIIGRTPVLPYDLSRADAFLFHAGDTVRFSPISSDDYRRLI